VNDRPYQSAAVASTADALTTARSALGVAATGLGKSRIMARNVRLRAGMGNRRQLVVAHRHELVNQLRDTMAALTGLSVGVDMAEYRSGREAVVVGTVQSLGNRLGRFAADEFECIHVDEAHHSIASSYGELFGYFKDAKIAGYTATPDRSDELAMGRRYDTIAFDYDIHFGVSQSWLVPVHSQRVHIKGLDLSGVRTTAGDLNAGDLAKIVEDERLMLEAASSLVDIVGNRRTIVFTASVYHAERFAEIINRFRPGTANWVCGETPKDERAARLKAFADGSIQFMCNCGVLTEGYDNPGVEVVAMARPTKSRALYTQMAGRALRPLPSAGIDNHHASEPNRRAAIASSGKASALIVDFVGNAGRHALVTTTDILAGDYDKEIVAKVTRRAGDGPVDVSAAMVEELAERRRIAALLAQQERDRRMGIVARAQYELVDVDPFETLDVPPIASRAWDSGHRARGPIVDRLRAEGVFKPETLGQAGARRLFAQILEGKLHGRPTYKQLAALKFLGVTNTPATQQQAADMLKQLGAKP